MIAKRLFIRSLFWHTSIKQRCRRNVSVSPIRFPKYDVEIAPEVFKRCYCAILVPFLINTVWYGNSMNFGTNHYALVMLVTLGIEKFCNITLDRFHHFNTVVSHGYSEIDYKFIYNNVSFIPEWLPHTDPYLKSSWDLIYHIALPQY